MDEYGANWSEGPFGDVPFQSGRALQRFSFASQWGAENLLRKARRAFDDGDSERAAAFVDRAVQLPFDEHEEVYPAALAVHMDLFTAVTDALERSEEDDSRWLDAASDALSSADERAACDLRDVLAAIDQDYSISPLEHRRISAAIAPIPERAALRDLPLTAAELREHVMSTLDVRRAYGRAFDVLRA